MNLKNLAMLFGLFVGTLSQAPYIGGNKPNYLQNNPALIQKYMEELTGNNVAEACKNIPGIGPAVLSIRQAQ